MNPEIVDNGEVFYGEFPKHGVMVWLIRRPDGRRSMA
jgi:hypothetical protein